MVFIQFPFHCDLKVLDYEKHSTSVGLIRDDIVSYLGYDQFSLLHNGKPLQDVDLIQNNSRIWVTFSLPGGKGGFGSMLRAIGAQIEKTTNREACRDLSGRRLRDINEEQRLKKWIAKKAEREEEKIRRRQERIERLKSKAPHKFFDFEYEKEISELPNRINDALSEGLQKAKQPAKRPFEKPELPKNSWLSDDFPISSSDSDSDERNSSSGDSPAKKPKLTLKDSSSCESEISELSQSLPGSSKDCSFVMEESSTSCDTKIASMEGENGENSVESENIDPKHEQAMANEIVQYKPNEDINVVATSNTKITESTDIINEKNTKDITKLEKCVESDSTTQSKLDESSIDKKSNTKDDSAIDLLDFKSVAELEALGLDRLKSALMARGLKCGGNLSDRAQRLWKVRGLQPQKYPANLLAKNKK